MIGIVAFGMLQQSTTEDTLDLCYDAIFVDHTKPQHAEATLPVVGDK